MGESIFLGLWNVIVFFANFLVKAIVDAGAEVLFQRAGLIVLAVVVVAAIALIIARSRRRARGGIGGSGKRHER